MGRAFLFYCYKNYSRMGIYELWRRNCGGTNKKSIAVRGIILLHSCLFRKSLLNLKIEWLMPYAL